MAQVASDDTSSLASQAEPGSAKLYLGEQASLFDAIEAFGHDPELRLLPVVDASHHPVGALFEKDLRRLLSNPYGHALIRNPSAGLTLSNYVKPCPHADVDAPLGEVLDTYTGRGGREGLILTRGRRFCGFIMNRRLLALAAVREAARADALAKAAQSFEEDATTFAHELARLATQLKTASGGTRQRASHTDRHASEVASAATQLNDNVAEMARQSATIAAALGHLHAETADARDAARTASALVRTSSARAAELVDIATSIEASVRSIEGIAGSVTTLALNATIEASRAGEMGLGFAVVAREVRSLAGQARDAAGSIAAQASAIFSASQAVSQGQQGMAGIIERVAQLSQSVENAMADQRRITGMVARAAGEAAAANEDICRNIQHIGANARQASDFSGDMEDHAVDLAASTARLQERVARFTEAVRSY